MFNGVSTNGTSHWLIQIGSGSITNTGYNAVAAGCINAVAPSVTLSTSGFIAFNDSAADVRSGSMEIALLGSNVYVAKHTLGGTGGRSIAWWGGGNVTLSGPLDRIRVTTANGTDVFDAGTINIMVE
jgi:hypothetical protein